MCNEDLAKAKFTEHINDSLHGRVVSDSDGSQIKDAPQLYRRRTTPGGRYIWRKQN